MRMIEMALHEWTRQGVERIGKKYSTSLLIRLLHKGTIVQQR